MNGRMTWGKFLAGGIVVIALLAGAAMYWLQEYAYYTEASFKPGAEIMLTTIEGQQPEPIIADHVTGIDADSSPLRFRACFHTSMDQAMLTETYVAYPKAVPLNGSTWFSCFNATEIGEALEKGQALAFLSQSNIAPEIDRVVAVFPDGRAFAWHQLSPDAGE
jgi:hypothetical protein